MYTYNELNSLAVTRAGYGLVTLSSAEVERNIRTGTGDSYRSCWVIRSHATAGYSDPVQAGFKGTQFATDTGSRARTVSFEALRKNIY